VVELMRKRGKVGFCKVDAYDNSRLWREDHMDSDAVNTTVTLRAAAKIANAFEWPGQPPKIALSLGGSAPHVINGSCCQPKFSSKTACQAVWPVLHSTP